MDSSLYKSIHKAYESATKKLQTRVINDILSEAVKEHQPPLVHGRRIKLRYAHVGGHNPPIIVIHGNQTSAVPAAYKRYLENRFIKALKLEGTPIRIQFKQSENPYSEDSDKKTKKPRLTDRHLDHKQLTDKKSGAKSGKPLGKKTQKKKRTR